MVRQAHHRFAIGDLGLPRHYVPRNDPPSHKVLRRAGNVTSPSTFVKTKPPAELGAKRYGNDGAGPTLHTTYCHTETIIAITDCRFSIAASTFGLLAMTLLRTRCFGGQAM